MNAQKVKLLEITCEKDKLVTTNQPTLVELGVANVTDLLVQVSTNDLLQKYRAQNSGRVFLIDWEGGRIPRGVSILGHEIGWTQHGMVTSTKSEMIGTYDRLIDSGGANRDQQRMLIYLDASAVTLVT